jgi:hypothetical protein
MTTTPTKSNFIVKVAVFAELAGERTSFTATLAMLAFQLKLKTNTSIFQM